MVKAASDDGCGFRGGYWMRRVVFGLVMVVFGGVALGQSTGWPVGPGHTVVTLWPKGAPGVNTTTGPEADTSAAASPLVAGKSVVRLGNVSVPTLTVFAPTTKGNGAAVVVFPGGGYNILAMDLEGTEVCDWLTSRGVACFLLKYRVPGTGPYPKSDEALQDAQRAVGLVRARAAEWKVDPKRVGVLGFSAGAHLAAAVSTHYETRLYPKVDAADDVSCRPDFAVVMYPGYLALEDKNFAFTPDIPVTKDTPPTFLVQAEDDTVHVENATAYFLALKGAGVPTELHIYAEGGHGYGLRKTGLPVTEWPGLVDVWMKTIKVAP
jgi:acetyl esterase/lipase